MMVSSRVEQALIYWAMLATMIPVFLSGHQLHPKQQVDLLAKADMFTPYVLAVVRLMLMHRLGEGVHSLMRPKLQFQAEFPHLISWVPDKWGPLDLLVHL